MKMLVVRLVASVVIFTAGAVFWREGTATDRVANARQRLATLRFDVDDALEDATSLTDRLPGNGSLAQTVRQHQALFDYWTSRYDAIADSQPKGFAASAEPDEDADPRLLLVAANAAFRSAQRSRPDQRTAITKLDDVLQAYAGVLKTGGRHPDAAYNYEFVARVRDTVANGKPLMPAPSAGTAEESASDLPPGRTAHGRPGGPPAGARMDQFEVVMPKRGDERGSDPDQNSAKRPPRRG